MKSIKFLTTILLFSGLSLKHVYITACRELVEVLPWLQRQRGGDEQQIEARV